MNEYETKHGTLPVITAKTQDATVSVIKGRGRKQMKSSYSFDNVFTAFSTQEEVFDATVKPVILDVMRGFESTVFAYGQTGTGKTHTSELHITIFMILLVIVFGSTYLMKLCFALILLTSLSSVEGSLTSPEFYGIIPRSARAMFDHLKQPQYKEQVVTCSYLEIYNEELRDLLVEGNGTKMEIMEGKEGTFTRGLTEKQVYSAADVLSLMQKAQHSRMIGETKMNKASSRSHCLFTIQVQGKISLLDGEGDMQFNGKLHMVDLAGSECAKSAGNDKSCPDAAARERERMNINRSLLTLGRVITILKEKSLNKNTNARVPYRDCKLTRVLQEALGGRCKTVIIATVSPSITAVEESISTLNYAHSANGIVNTPISSSLIAFGDNIPGFDDSKPSAITIDSWQEMEMKLQYMQTQVDEAQAALARKHIQQMELQDRAEKSESELLEKKQKLYDAKKRIISLEREVESETSKRIQMEQKLFETQVQLKKKELILKATQDTESSLTFEAQTLISKLEDIVQERNDLHKLILTQRSQEVERRNVTKQFHSTALSVLNNINSTFTSLSSNIELSQSDAMKISSLNHTVGRKSITDSQQLIANIAKNVSCVTDSIKSQLTGDGGIVSTLEGSSKSITHLIQSANTDFAMGETSLTESSELLRHRLEECTKELGCCSTAIQTSTSHALQSFESNVIETRNVISHLVMRMKNSLSSLSQSKIEKAKTLDSLIEKWKEESIACTNSLLDGATSTSKSLEVFIGNFEKSMHHHDKMKNSLKEQQSFLNTTGPVCVHAMDQQTLLLNEHRLRLAASHDAQVKLQNDVMQSIMLGMNALVSSEIKKLADTQLNYFQVLDKDGMDLSSTNDRITQSAKQVIQNMQSTNELVSENASIVHSNDLKANDTMQSTVAVLHEVMSIANNNNVSTNSFVSKSLATVAEMKQLDDQNLEIVKAVERDEKSCSSSLINTIFKPTSADLKNVMQLGQNAIAYVNDTVMTNANNDLDGIATNRQDITNQMNDKFRSVSAQISEVTGRIQTIAKTQYDIAHTLGEETLAASNKHSNEAVPYYEAEFDSGKERLTSLMSTLAGTSSRTVSEGQVQSSIVAMSVEDFAHNKMQCTKAVDPAPTMSDCTFNCKLSSTPAEEIILRGFDSDGVRPEESETAILKDNSSQEMEDDDNVSRTSSTSFITCAEHSLPSPRLRYRDINTKTNRSTSESTNKTQHHKRHGSGIPSMNTIRERSNNLSEAMEEGRSSSTLSSRGRSGSPSNHHKRLPSPSASYDGHKRRKK